MALFGGAGAYVPFASGSGLRYITYFAQTSVLFTPKVPYRMPESKRRGVCPVFLMLDLRLLRIVVFSEGSRRRWRFPAHQFLKVGAVERFLLHQHFGNQFELVAVFD